MLRLGQRICIIGPSSAGKSTTAAYLGKKLSLPVIHLDQYAHVPHTNWKRRSNEEFQKEHDRLIQQDQWVMEGNYSFLMPQRLQRAQTVIFLKFNRFGCLYRFIKRATKRHPNRPGMLTGAQEQITWEIIWYILYKAPKRQKTYTDILKNYPHLKVITIHDFNHLNALTENAMR